MEVEDYLKNRLENCAKYELTDLDKQILDKEGIEEYIFKKLTSKKFRKWAITSSVQEKVRAVIRHCVTHQKPIRLDFSFGGFKLWRLHTAPEPDWSEFFSLAYYVQYVSPIVAVYQPGVSFDFSSGDIALTAVNNVPRQDVDRYYQSFGILLNIFKGSLPGNLKIGLSRLRDLFKDEKDYLEQVEVYLPGFRKSLEQNSDYYKELSKGSVQNYQLIGGIEDVSGLSEVELARRRTYSYEIAEGMYDMPRITEKNGEDTISLLATKLTLSSPNVMIGTTKRTTAKFWAGVGALVKDRGSFADYVITPKQWEAIKNQPHETIKSDLIPLKNFKEILIYPEKFNFSAQ